MRSEVHVEQAAFHEGADGGLVVGVDRGVHRREDGLGGDRRQRDRAVQVRRVGRVVEPDGVLEEQLDRSRGWRWPCPTPSASRCDAVDELLQVRAGRAGERLGHRLEARRHSGRGLSDERAIEVGSGACQQLVHQHSFS